MFVWFHNVGLNVGLLSFYNSGVHNVGLNVCLSTTVVFIM